MTAVNAHELNPRPGVDIFTSRYVLRGGCGWQRTDAGREFAGSIEAAPAEQAIEPTRLPQNVIQLSGYKVRRRRAAATRVALHPSR